LNNLVFIARVDSHTFLDFLAGAGSDRATGGKVAKLEIPIGTRASPLVRCLWRFVHMQTIGEQDMPEAVDFETSEMSLRVDSRTISAGF